MSRTYRKTRYREMFSTWDYILRESYVAYSEIDFSQVEKVKYLPGWCWTTEDYYIVYYRRDSKEGKKRIAKYHSDGEVHNFKEPGPSWFRNLTNTRPIRRYNKNELKKYLADQEYEPMCESMGKLEYWT